MKKGKIKALFIGDLRLLGPAVYVHTNMHMHITRYTSIHYLHQGSSIFHLSMLIVLPDLTFSR